MQINLESFTYLKCLTVTLKNKRKSCSPVKELALRQMKLPMLKTRYVLNILATAAPSQQAVTMQALLMQVKHKLGFFLLYCEVLEAVNFKTVHKAIWETVEKSALPFDRTTAFVTNNAMYMRKAWDRGLKTLFLKAAHLTCMAHLLNFVGSL